MPIYIYVFNGIYATAMNQKNNLFLNGNNINSFLHAYTHRQYRRCV